jgi:predicted metalloprotease with PDZ domain
VKTVHRASPAERAGVAAGDELLAVDGWRVRRLDDARAWIDGQKPVALTAVRDQRLVQLSLTPDAAPPSGVTLKLADKPTPAARALRREWLGV